MRHLAAALILAASPAFAGVEEAIDDHILPATAAFEAATEDLARTAQADCRAETLRSAYQDAFDAWMGISHLRLGPLEEGGRALAIGFWPDTRGMVQRTVAGLLADADPVVESPEAFAEVSVAGRGLFALERLLYDDAVSGYGADDYACALATAIARDLHRMAEDIDTEWREDFAATLRTAGKPGNDTFLTDKEAAQALYTALTTGLEFTKDQRLGRPMGTFDRPRPERAEARRAGRSLHNVELSLEALRDLARALATGPTPDTEAAFAAALELAAELDPVLADVAQVQGRFEAEILQQRIEAIQHAVANEIGVTLGVSAGFNATDGD